MGHQHIIATVKHLIESGQWQVGAPIPTTSQLMQQFGVSRSTIERAIAWLDGAGYIRGEQGGRRYVADGWTTHR